MGAQMTNIQHDIGREAMRAWREVRPLELEPNGIEIVSGKEKSSVYRLLGATRTGSTVIAKRCVHWGMRVERTIYEGVAGLLPIGMPKYYGCIEEENNDWYWLFLEDVGDTRLTLSKCENITLAARWLASLHETTASESAKSRLPSAGPFYFCSPWDPAGKQLPERGTEYYGWTMQIGHEMLLRLRSSHEVLIEGILPLYDVVERCWPVIERLCGATPRIIAHGDFVEKNLCIKKGTEDILIAVDWESAGWSTPAIDLAFLYERANDSILAEYCAGVRNNWPGVSVELVRELVHVGVLCRALAALYWEAQVLPYSSSPAAENMLIYARRLSTALAVLGFPPGE
jgi:hypothetical protein